MSTTYDLNLEYDITGDVGNPGRVAEELAMEIDGCFYYVGKDAGYEASDSRITTVDTPTGLTAYVSCMLTHVIGTEATETEIRELVAHENSTLDNDVEIDWTIADCRVTELKKR